MDAACRRSFVLTHFIKWERLSGFAACWPDRRACNPALRFLARFLLLEFAVGLDVSGAASFLILAGALALSRTAGPGGGSVILVSRRQLTQCKVLILLVAFGDLVEPKLEPVAAVEADPFVFLRKTLRVSGFVIFPQFVMGIMPQPPHAR